MCLVILSSIPKIIRVIRTLCSRLQHSWTMKKQTMGTVSRLLPLNPLPHCPTADTCYNTSVPAGWIAYAEFKIDNQIAAALFPTDRGLSDYQAMLSLCRVYEISPLFGRWISAYWLRTAIVSKITLFPPCKLCFCCCFSVTFLF